MTRLDANLPVALRQGDWDAVLSLLDKAKPDARLVNLNFLAGELREFANGMSAVEKGNLAAAETASKKLDAALREKSPKSPAEKPNGKPNRHPKGPVQEPLDADASLNPLVENLKIMALELRAEIALAQKDSAKAKVLFAEAGTAEKKLGYREPPVFVCPVSETQGLALLRAGDSAGAHAAFTAALVERPNTGFGLYGQARSSEAAGNIPQAQSEYGKFLVAWKDAEGDLSQIKHAQEFLQAHPVLASLR